MKKTSTFFFSIVPFLLAMGIQYIAVFFLMFLSAIFMFVVAPKLTGNSYVYDDLMTLWMDMDFNAIVMIIFSVSCSAIFALWYYKSCGGNFLPNVKKTFHPLQFLGLILLTPGTQFFTSILIGVVSTVFPSWLEAYEELMESAGMGNEITIFMMIYSVLLAPISEELIFRGVTMRIARRAFPFWIANIIQAVLFGAFHMNMLQGVYAFVLGLILGYICERGGSIYLSIIFHFFFNLWGTTTSELLNSMPEAVLGMLVIFGTIIGLTAGFILFIKGTRLTKRNG